MKLTFMKKLITSLQFLFLTVIAFGQISPNNECNGAIILPNVLNYCSEIGEFSNINATASPQPAPTCWGQNPDHDVWFAFTARSTGISIRVIGGTRIFSGGVIRQPLMALYSGTCNSLNLLDCDVDVLDPVNNQFTNVVTVQSTSLQVGETYFFRVDAQSGSTRDFQICITSFNPVPEAQSDCTDAVLLCDKSPFIVPFLSGFGDERELIGPTCTGADGACNYDELQSAWYKWQCLDAGILTMNFTPLNPVDDIDFWIFELPNGIDDCTDRIPMLCMASGATGGPPSDWIRCHGPTGLRSGETDDHENCGCDPDDNNYIMPLQMEAGKTYALLVMNFSQSADGFSIDFGGSGTFLGPTVDFTIDPELENQCDIDSISIFDFSTPGIGNIASYNWDFGSGGIPRTSSTIGPHEIVYESFGTKNIVLRITSDAGCVVTKIKEIFIKPCCDPNDALTINLDSALDPPCPETASGSIQVSGSAGNPSYEFSLDGINFYPINNFTGLLSGDYEIWIQDIKGCRDSMIQSLVEPPPFLVDAGPNASIDLGCAIDLNAIVLSADPNYTAEWASDPSMDSTERAILDPEVRPFYNTTYTITAHSDAGCSSTDSVTIFLICGFSKSLSLIFLINFA